LTHILTNPRNLLNTNNLLLPGDLRPAICIFYLVLRALDTVEDDMTIPRGEKEGMLRKFHSYLYNPDWRYMDSNEKDKAVLEEFPVISGEFRKLEPVFQEVISDITQKMGSGMCVFLEDRVGSMTQWDEYCHYVAGLVGIGLSRLFAASGLEEKEVGLDHRLANSMGLFLQKTNIIRDYLEDVQEERHFWPKEAWSQFGSQLEDLALPQHRTAAVHCLNLLITNALQHVPDVLLYMSRIRNQSVFNFCAIPQTMAIATLAVCYNNPNVFTGVVKIRKGQAVALMMESTNMTQIQAIMTQFAEEVTQKIEEGDPSGSDTRAITQQIKNLCCQSRPPHPSSPSPLSPQALSLPLVGLVMAGAAASLVYWSTNYSSTTV
jgi:farnesyl-diphosphate farnesyltransferase